MWLVSLSRIVGFSPCAPSLILSLSGAELRDLEADGKVVLQAVAMSGRSRLTARWCWR